MRRRTEVLGDLLPGDHLTLPIREVDSRDSIRISQRGLKYSQLAKNSLRISCCSEVNDVSEA
jgi:hypothetical protein